MGPGRKNTKRPKTAPATPRRRSARLAGEPPSSASNLTTVPDARGREQSIPSPPKDSLDEESEQVPFDMELAIRPPRRIAAGKTLEAPLVVTFSVPKVKKRTHERMQDLSGVWAFVSLMTEDRSESLAPPQRDLLSGRTADSMHPIERGNDREGQPVAYATFPGLAITRPGRYCFKVNIIDMNQPSAEEARGSAVKVLRALHSDVFDVVESAQHSGLDATMRETMDQLRAIGANL